MNMRIQRAPAFTMVNENILKIKDAFVLGIYCFMEMETYQGRLGISEMIDKMEKQFGTTNEKILEAMRVIIDELELIQMVKKESD